MAPLRTGVPSMLLGADGKPLKKGGSSPSPPAGGGAAGGGGSGLSDYGVAVPADLADGTSRGAVLDLSDVPDDLKGFDPTFDPLAAPRPTYSLAAASGRSTEVVWGAEAADSADGVAAWAAHLREKGVARVLGLFSTEEAAARSAAGTAEGYFQALADAGFDTARIGLLDPRVPGARDAAWGVLSAAKEAKEVVCVHCADGNKNTAVLLSDWLLTDYIGGGDNYEEATHALQSRKRLSGVGRTAEPETLGRWIEEGHL